MIGSAVLVVLGAGAATFFGLRGEPSGPNGSRPPTSTPPAPHFSFALASVRSLPTGATKGVQQSAHAAALHIRQTLDTIYATGFIDPATWRAAHYGNVWRAFTKDAIGKARSDESTLTLGSHAARVFSGVSPHSGSLALRILIDPKGRPSTAVANVTFAARGTMRSGRVEVIRSNGHYFLRPRNHGWAIYAYEVTRNDAPLPTPSPAPSGSSRPSAGSTP